MISRRRVIVGAAACLPGTVTFLAVRTTLDRWRAPAVERRERVSLGISESAVLDLLGPPYRRHDRADGVADYHVSGFARPNRDIAARVLIYMEKDMVLYVYLDHQGRMEDVFIGGS